jgi:hypothetical protein
LGTGLPDNHGDENYLILHNDNDSWGDITESFGMDGYLVEYEPPATPSTARIGILPNPVVGGMTTVGVVTLDRPTGPDDLVIPLASSDPAVAVVPRVVVVPAGSAGATFSILTFPVPVAMAVTLTASGPDGARPATLQVQPVGTLFPPGNLLMNGSFEQPHLTAPQLTTDLPGWRITQGSVDIVSGWQPAPGQGSQSLHLLGSPGAGGAIEQSFATEPGRLYTLTGWVAHHPEIEAGRAQLLVDGMLLAQLYHSNALYGPASPADMR